jgi:outer membrane protein assembly factor BamB
VGSDDGKLYALDAATGNLKWSYQTGGEVASAPAVAGDLVFFGSYDHKIYALNTADGGLVWSYLTGGWVVSSPAVVNGVLYVGSYDHFVYAVGTIQDIQDQTGYPDLFIVIVSGGLIVALILVGIVYWRKRQEERFFGKYFRSNRNIMVKHDES